MQKTAVDSGVSKERKDAWFVYEGLIFIRLLF